MHRAMEDVSLSLFMVPGLSELVYLSVFMLCKCVKFTSSLVFEL